MGLFDTKKNEGETDGDARDFKKDMNQAYGYDEKQDSKAKDFVNFIVDYLKQSKEAKGQKLASTV
jgi:hypothetical protein